MGLNNFFGGSDDDKYTKDEVDEFFERIDEMVEKSMEDENVSIEDMLNDQEQRELDEGYRNNQSRRVTVEIDVNQLNGIVAMATNEYYQVQGQNGYYSETIRGILQEVLRVLAEEEDEDLETICEQLGLTKHEIFPARDDDAGIEE